MKLQLEKTFENGIYSTEFSLTSVNEFDKAMLEDRNGLIYLNTGGNITEVVMEDDGSGVEVPVEKLLLKQDDRFILFASALPFTKSWSIAQHGSDTENIAENYNRLKIKEIEQIIEDMKSNPDNFSGIQEIILTT